MAVSLSESSEAAMLCNDSEFIKDMIKGCKLESTCSISFVNQFLIN